MKTKAIKDLIQLDKNNFYNNISIGINHIINNSLAMFEDAELLHKANHQRGNSILQVFANEEVAKLLILLDAVRCPYTFKEILSKQLSLFNDHLAKGIYVEACDWKIETYGELVDAVNSERRRFYLDGPNDVDWIFYNRILCGREESIYVDYVENEGKHFWQFPQDLQFLNQPNSCAIDLCISMKELGILSPIGLEEIAKFWESIRVENSCSYMELREIYINMLDYLEDKEIIVNKKDKDIDRLLECWQFPMYMLDFSLAKEDNTKELKEIQNNWIQY